MPPSPHRLGMLDVLPSVLITELSRAEEEFMKNIEETEGLRQKADAWIRTGELDNHFEHLEAELHTECHERLQVFRNKLRSQVKEILLCWKDGVGDE